MQMSKKELVAVLRRVGRVDLIDEVNRTLPDPVDTVRDAQLLAHYGLTRGQLVDQIGGSP